MSAECSIPKCAAIATVLIEWGHGFGKEKQPFRDWLCKGCAANLLQHDGPRRIEQAGESQARSLTAPDL